MKYFTVSIYLLIFANVNQKGNSPTKQQTKTDNKNYEGKIDDKSGICRF